MANSLGKFIKYIIILGIIGIVIFFGIKVLFPAPKPTVAFETTQDLTQSQSLDKLITTNQDFLQLYQETVGEDESQEDAKKMILLYSTNTLLKTQVYALDFLLDEIIFAENSSVYNSNTSNMIKTSLALQRAFENVDTYITTYISPLLSKYQIPTPTILNSVYVNITEYNNQVSNLLSDYIIAANNVFSSLKETYSVNNYSRKLFQITTFWQEIQSKLIADKANITDYNKLFASTNSMFSFVNTKLTQAEAFSYANTPVAKQEFLKTISQVRIKELLNALTTHEDITSYIAEIEPLELSTSTDVFYNFIIGE
jgi:hypothetical protein